MIINGMPGKFYHKALFKDIFQTLNDDLNYSAAWTLSPGYFESLAKAKEFYGHEYVQWPADQIAEGTVYIPSEEELNEA